MDKTEWKEPESCLEIGMEGNLEQQDVRCAHVQLCVDPTIGRYIDRYINIKMCNVKNDIWKGLSKIAKKYPLSSGIVFLVDGGNVTNKQFLFAFVANSKGKIINVVDYSKTSLVLGVKYSL